MRITIEQSDFIQLEFGIDDRNYADNSNLYHFKISTPGGQPLIFAGEERSEIEFSICGPIELEEFFRAMKVAQLVSSGFT